MFIQAEPVQTLAEESRAEGTIGVSLYVKYLRAGASIVVLLVVILINILAQVCRSPAEATNEEKQLPPLEI